jgi:riboflavin biosynthesis pyrimidine reductase
VDGWLPCPGVRQILPEPLDAADPLECYGGDARPAPADRPWVMVNMVTTLDGATAVEGVSGDLGGPGDRAVFAALRTLPDVIMVASATANAETYGPPVVDPLGTQWRADHGLAPLPRIAVVTGSLSIEPALRLFTESTPPGPLVITGGAGDPDRRATLADVATIVEAGQERVDLEAALGRLHADGSRLVLVEGGPSLNGQLLDLDLVDEVCLTLSPVAAGGESPRLFGRAGAGLRGFALDRVLEDGGALFLRYVRAR